ncbi:hypothetical protein Y032_0213g2298 [Ancylostoma ceylanicum]|nr:hypothetical protein Y032_0213g2298 [Ancylostoma ceylanicum]
MKREQKDRRALTEVNVMIWDEASMIPRKALGTVDELLRDIMQNEQSFGGKAMVLGASSVVAFHRLGTIIISNMGVTTGDNEWYDFLLKIGSCTENDEDERTASPSGIICAGNIVSAVNAETIDARDMDSLSIRAILAPKNRNVDQLNAEVLSRIVVRKGYTRALMKR